MLEHNVFLDLAVVLLSGPGGKSAVIMSGALGVLSSLIIGLLGARACADDLGPLMALEIIVGIVVMPFVAMALIDDAWPFFTLIGSILGMVFTPLFAFEEKATNEKEQKNKDAEV